LKWLKDRQGSTLTFEDISQYQGVIASICQTIEVMDEIDTIMTPFLAPEDEERD